MVLRSTRNCRCTRCDFPPISIEGRHGFRTFDCPFVRSTAQMSTQEASSPADSTKSPYELLGGDAGVTEAVDRFYGRVLGDPDLAPFFTATDVQRLKAHQVTLVTKLLGGPDRYGGRDLAAAHAGLAITDAHFAKVGEHLVAVLAELGADGATLASLGETLAAVRPTIVNAG